VTSHKGVIACAVCLAALVLAAPASAAVSAEFVDDLNPGADASDPGNFVNVDGVVFFTATDATHGTELWSTDGTIEGTEMVKDINAGSGGSDPSDLTSVDGELYFAAYDDAAGNELWKSDGTAAGTVMVKDLQPGGDPSYPDNLTNVGGTLFFAGDDATAGTELWKSDGTPAGTEMVEDINPNGSDGSSPQELRAVGSTLYFAADDGTNGTELWSSDGTAGGTSMLDDINPGSDSSDPGELTELNGKVYFAATTDATGRELWAKNVSGGPAFLVKDIAPGLIGLFPASGFPAGLTVLNNRILFKAETGPGAQGLWSSDGTAVGTVELQELTTMSQALKRVGGTVFFVGFDLAHGSELWKTDGTLAGTEVLDVTPGSGGTAITLHAGFATAQGRLFFAAGTDNELWSSDGTVAGTGEVANINPNGPGSPHNLVDIQGRLHFAADDGEHGSELWRTRIDLDPTIDSGPSGPTDDVRPTFTFSSDDLTASFTCSLDTGTANFGPCSDVTSHQPAADLADGSYVFRVRATDPFGNFATAARAFVVDTVPPAVSISGGPTGPTNDQRPTFTFNAEAGATLNCSIDTGTPSFAPCSGATSHQPATDLADGSYTFRVQASDAAGNSATVTRTFTVIDIVPPSLAISGGPSGPTNDPRPAFTFTVEAGAGLQCSIDTGTASYGPCSGASGHQPATDLADGSYVFRVRASDAAGNQTTQTRSFSVDTTTPALSITGGPTATTTDRRPTFSFDAEPGSTLQCMVDAGGGSYGPCSGAASHQPAADLADGNYTFRVRATDVAGNQATDTRTFTVTPGTDPPPTDPPPTDPPPTDPPPWDPPPTDPPPTDPPATDPPAPDVRITGGPSRSTKDSTPTFTFSSSDTSATFRCSVDGKAAAPCSSPSTLRKLKAGKHTFSVTAVSSANKQSAPATRSFKVKKKRRR
jgi:ELWxxDGT repeat protein